MGQHIAPRLQIAGPLLTLEQAAALLGVTPSTLRQRARAGNLLSFRRGRKLYTTRKWVEQYRAAHQGKPGRARAILPLGDEIARRVADLLGLDLPATFEDLDRLFFQAARQVVVARPRVDRRELEEALAAYRAVLVDGEGEQHGETAVRAVVDAVFQDLLVADVRYRAMREDARGRPSEPGRRWRALFWERLAALTVDPRVPGTIARLDVAVARELAGELRRLRSDLPVPDLEATLAQAMLEGSENLPGPAAECRAAIEATVREVLAGMDAPDRADTETDPPSRQAGGTPAGVPGEPTD